MKSRIIARFLKSTGHAERDYNWLSTMKRMERTRFCREAR
jgi:hypothetical protein